MKDNALSLKVPNAYKRLHSVPGYKETGRENASKSKVFFWNY